MSTGSHIRHTWGECGSFKFHHGAPFRLAVKTGLLDPRTIQIGIRGGQNFRSPRKQAINFNVQC